jgi:two-component system phosphate regulon sensor histidine kinase PhoR
LIRSRIFWRLFTSFGLLLLAALALLGALISVRVERHENEQIEQSLLVKAALVELAVRDLPANDLQKRVLELRQKSTTRITLIAADGRVLADSDEDPVHMENHAERPEVVEATRTGTGTATRYSHTVAETLMYAARRVGGSGPVAVVRVARSVESIQTQLADLRRLVWGVAGGTAAAAMLLAFVLARRLARPIQELTAGAERIATGEYGHKVYAVGPDEIGTLARAFNAMSERLADQFAQVEEDRQQLRAVLSGMVEGVVAIDADQRILFANERAAQLLGFAVSTAVSRKLWEVVRQLGIQEVVRRGLAGSEPYHEELNWNGPGCSSLVVHVTQLPGNPAARGAVLVLHDTSELRRLERIRQEFVANVSHELKTPLAIIKANVETLLDGAVDDAEHRGYFLELIDEQANRLHMLILDLLSLARIESSAEAFEFQTVPLAPLVADCLDRHRARAEARGQLLEAMGNAERGTGNGDQTVATASPPRSSTLPVPRSAFPVNELAAWADEEALHQILDNLVDNAVKYTPSGGRIAVNWYAEDDQVCLEVSDTGIGIPERDLPRIFERFYRVDKARSRELGGTGLGLSIVKHLVQAMQGSIRATSQLGQGTTFVVRLPRRSAL